MTDKTPAESEAGIELTYVEDEIRESYIDYAMSVIVGRALPDVRDGLKPVHRRILYAMSDLGLTYRGAHKKSARIVGEVLGKYHPHGDSAVYNSLVRMAQEFSLRYPLVDGQGNFGSVDGDNPAAMRYTEAKLEKLSDEMLRDIDEDTVPFRPNFDDSLQEPEVLPCRFPNLLVNGSSGIAVGMSTNIPPHNLGEIVDATVALVRDPDLTVDQLREHVPGPDFPTGGLICTEEGLKEMYRTGRGKFTVRGRMRQEEDETKNQLVIYELPYMVNKSKLVEKIAREVEEERIEGIRDLRDESDRDGIRVVIELKQGVTPEIVENQIYKHTGLEKTFGANMLALVDHEPETLTLKQMLQKFIDHRRTVIRRRTRYRLRKARERAHVLEGYRIAIANIDDVVEIIKTADSPEDGKQTLMETYEVTEKQATAILRMQLQRLTSMEVDKIEQEYEELKEKIADYEEILESDSRVRDLIAGELNEVKDEFDDERRTDFVDEPLDVSKEDLIEDEAAVLTLSENGYIKRTDPENFRLQKRGGRGIYGADPKDGDAISHVFSAFTHDYLLVFTSKGQCYWLKVYDVPEGGRRSVGTPIINLISVDTDETVRSMIPVRELTDGYLVMCTKNGRVKKTDLEAFSRPRSGGIIGIGLPADDELVTVRRSGGEDDLMLATAEGMSIRFPESDVRPMGRDTRGVKGISLKDDDRVVGMAVVDEQADLLTITRNGYGKRTPFHEYRAQTRGGMGLVNIKGRDRNGSVVTVLAATDRDELITISDRGILLRTRVSEISRYGRGTQGVKIMNVMEGQQVANATLGARDDSGSTGSEDLDD